MASLTTIRSLTGKTTQVNSAYAGNFQSFLKDLHSEGYSVGALGGYNYRTIAGTDKLSNHAFGNAIDINPFNGQSVWGGRSAAHDLPSNISDIAARNGLEWGGNWRNPDSMHFEVAKGAAPIPFEGFDMQSAGGGSAASKGNFLPDSMYGPDALKSDISPAGSSPYGALGDQNPSAPQQATNNGAFGDYMPGGSLYDPQGGGSPAAGGSAGDAYPDYSSKDAPVLTIKKSAEEASKGYDPRKANLKKDDVPTAIVEAGKAQASAAKAAQEQSDKAAGARQISAQQRALDIFQRVILGALGLIFVAAGVYGLSRRAGVVNAKVENFIK